MQPIKKIAQFILEPSDSDCGRLIPDDVFDSVKQYEYTNGRLNVQKRKAFGLIDFTSEVSNEQKRYTLSLTLFRIYKRHWDLKIIQDLVFIYVLDDQGSIQQELNLLELKK